MRLCAVLLLLLAFPALSQAAACESRAGKAVWMKELQKGAKGDDDKRSEAAACLVRSGAWGSPEVSALLLQVLKNPSEHVFVKEDLVESLSEVSWRKTVHVHAPLAPSDIKKEDKEALGRTVASAKTLVDIAQAVTEMDDVVPVSKQEGEFLKTIAELSLSTESHIMLRQAATQSLAKITESIAESGVYDEKNLRIALDAIRFGAAQDDNASYYSGARFALEQIRDGKAAVIAGISKNRSGRQISSVPAK